ncbi:uncharacterized protein TNCV_3352121 [Trichonephila clavipes]|nr:uncharacterized protein TNCV_3352121 [Trichonephila clavipes]
MITGDKSILSMKTSRTVQLHEGFLATNQVILNHGQVTSTTSELALPLLTTTPHQRNDVSALNRFKVQRFPTRRVFSGTGLKLVTKQATIRYLYHSATAATAIRYKHQTKKTGMFHDNAGHMVLWNSSETRRVRVGNSVTSPSYLITRRYKHPPIITLPLRHEDTLNYRQSSNLLLRLVKEEERWEAPDLPEYSSSKLVWNRVKPYCHLHGAEGYNQRHL